MEHYISPIAVNFSITELCNARCVFCGVNHNGYIDQKFASFDKIKKLIDIFKENEILRINFFGGEPFIYPHIKDAIIYAKEKGFLVTAVSNGLNFEEKLCKELHGLIDGIGISLHGLEKTHEELMQVKNSFERILKSIEYIKKSDIPVGLNMTITSENYKELKPLAELIKLNYDIEFIALNRFIPNKYLSEIINNRLNPGIEKLRATLYDLKDLQSKYPEMSLKYAIHFPHCLIEEKELKGHIGSCGFGQSYCAVNQEGKLKMCSFADTIIGDLFNSSFKDLWHNHSLLKEYRNEEWMSLKCKNCNDKNICMSGCKISSGNAPFAPDIMLKK